MSGQRLRRNPHILTGGVNMQRRTFGTAMRYLVAVGTLVSSLAMFACGGGDNTQNVSATVGLTNSTVVAVQTVAFNFQSGQVFDPTISGTVTLTFNTVNTFTLVGVVGGTATGAVTYGSASGSSVGACTFNFLARGGLIPG